MSNDLPLVPSDENGSRGTSRFGIRFPRSRFRLILFMGIYFLFLAGLVWGGVSLFWYLRGTPPDDVWGHYYPQIKQSGIRAAGIEQGDETFDVLMLGASTIHPSFGNIESLLAEKLEKLLNRAVKTYNLAESAHTSRDSLFKMRLVADVPFDLILLYDGFNDIRMNNCPDELFREDYAHCSWYASMKRRVEAGKITLTNLAADSLSQRSQFIGLGGVELEYQKHGASLKTPVPFRANLHEILRLSEGKPFVLMTFAWFIPKDYDEQRFRQEHWGYSQVEGRTGFPVEFWGLPEDVSKCIQEHNKAIRELAPLFPNAILIDQEKLVTAQASNFIDACHLSDEGCALFVTKLIEGLKQGRVFEVKNENRASDR